MHPSLLSILDAYDTHTLTDIDEANASPVHTLTDMDFEVQATSGRNGYRVLGSRKGWN